MVKRKKKAAAPTKKTVVSKKTKREEDQPSSSKEESSETNEDLLFTPTEEKSSDNIENSTETTTTTTTTPEEQIPFLHDDSVCITEPSNEDNTSPGSPGEFIFAPFSHTGEGSSSSSNNMDSSKATSSESCSSSSTSASDKVVSLLTSIVGGHTRESVICSNNCNSSNSNTSSTGLSNAEPNRIEVIDVDELPDTPCSSIGDDVIEITPSNSNRTSRSNSPEIVLNRHVVDLTGTIEVERSEVVEGTEEDADDDGDVFLSLWSTMHHEKRKSRTITSISSGSSGSSTETKTNNNEDESESSSGAKLHCPICMDDFMQIVKTRRLMSTSCGHVFCGVCVKAAVETQKRCPTCRKKQTLKNLHPIFL